MGREAHRRVVEDLDPLLSIDEFVANDVSLFIDEVEDLLGPVLVGRVVGNVDECGAVRQAPGAQLRQSDVGASHAGGFGDHLAEVFPMDDVGGFLQLEVKVIPRRAKVPEHMEVADGAA